MKKRKMCEVGIHFSVPKEQMKHIYEAAEALAKVGITFDTGGSCCEKGKVDYYWEFDWSLKGPVVVTFKRFKEAHGDRDKKMEGQI